ncbi:hypothetical protein P885DRAFT_63129 [Corynascus similis CBS 632.67]
MNGLRPADDADGDVADQNRKKLLAEFGSVLEESLILSISNDRDLVEDYEEIRGILGQLAEPARAEAASGFDPSGLGSAAEIEGLLLDETTTSGNGVDSPAEYATTISDYSDRSENQRLTEQTDLSDDEKLQELRLVFEGRWRDHTLKLILKRNDGNLERAFDELLNRQYLEEEGCLPKGIDGFFAPDTAGRPSTSVAGRTHKGNGKNKKKVVAVKYKAVSPTVDDRELEGVKDFVTSANTKSARTSRAPATQQLASIPASARPLQSSALSLPPPTDFGASSLRAAAALRRMGPLGRQGAVVYTDRAREERGLSVAHTSLAAEAHVAQQSTATVLDLHGVFVMDGVRIAKQRVWAWWNNLGEDRKTLAKREGFTVVTGVGKHSAGGVSRLRQAVGAYLRNDGWRVETLTGSFYVTGRV